MKISDMIRELDARVDDLDYCSRQIDFYSESFEDKVTRDRYIIAIKSMWMATDALRSYQRIAGTDLPIDWSQTWEKG
jgi:hypothetical protein